MRIDSGFGILYKDRMYWVRWRGWRLYHGVDSRCNCKDVISFAPCTDCGAGC